MKGLKTLALLEPMTAAPKDCDRVGLCAAAALRDFREDAGRGLFQDGFCVGLQRHDAKLRWAVISSLDAKLRSAVNELQAFVVRAARSSSRRRVSIRCSGQTRKSTALRSHGRGLLSNRKRQIFIANRKFYYRI